MILDKIKPVLLITKPVEHQLGGDAGIDAGAAAMLALIIFIVLCGIIGMVVENTTLGNRRNRGDAEKVEDRKLVWAKFFLSFSFSMNMKKLLQTGGGGEDDDLRVLHGIRFISTCLVVMGHTYYTSIFGPARNLQDLVTILSGWKFTLTNGAFFCVDTFFFLSGFLLAYGTLGKFYSRRGVTIPQTIGMFFHRLYRLVPTMAFLIAFYMTLFKYLGSGALYPAFSK